MESRYEIEYDNKENGNRVCIIDIDGVLNYYPDCYVQYVNMEMNTSFRNIDEVKNTLSYRDYKTIKDKYRKSNYKKNLIPRMMAKDVLKTLGESFKVVIVTARPTDVYPELAKSTVDWLHRNEIYYDKIIFQRKKAAKITEEYYQAEFMVEDNRRIANEMSDLGFKVYLINNIHNKGEIGKNVIRIENLSQIEEYLNMGSVL